MDYIGETMSMHMIFLDIDTKKSRLLRGLPEDEKLNLIIWEIKRLQRLYNLGVALVYKTKNGYHIRFPQAYVPLHIRNAILESCLLIDRGYLWWCKKLRDCTLRISEKPVLKKIARGRYKAYIDDSSPKLLMVIQDEE